MSTLSNALDSVSQPYNSLSGPRKSPLQVMTENRDLLSNAVTRSLDEAIAQKRGLNASEDRDMTRARARLAEIEVRIDELKEEEDRLASAAQGRAASGQTGSWSLSGRSEIYRPDQPEVSFFRDLWTATRGDWAAAERLHRNNAEQGRETRALGNTGATGGSGGDFAPPGWLVDKFVNLARPGRVTADRCTKDALPSGVSSINIPKVLTGTTTAPQTTQNTAVSLTDLSTAALSSGITTIAGRQVVSMQLLEQSGVAFDQVILADLTASYAAQLDSGVIAGTGTGGQLRGILTMTGTNAVTYTSASPTLTSTTAANSFLHQVLRASNQVFTGVYRAPDSILMHPRRWAWVLDAIDTANRPLVAADGAQFNGAAVDGTPTAEGAAGKLGGLPVFLDPNLPTNLGAGTNQDVVVVGKMDEAYLWESGIRADAFMEPYADSMGVLLRVFGYSAFIPDRRPKAFSIITGTGLVDPGL